MSVNDKNKEHVFEKYTSFSKLISFRRTKDPNMNSMCTLSSSVIGGKILGNFTNLYSLYLNGSTQMGKLSSNTYYNMSSTGTIECWMKTNVSNSGFQGLVLKGGAYSLFLSNNILTAYDWVSGGAKGTSAALNDNTWHHVALSIQSGVTNGTNMYVDGALTSTFTYTIGSQNEVLVIGSGSAALVQLYTGYLDEVRVWSEALSSTYIASIYNKRISTVTPNLTGYWYMDEGSGSTLKNAISEGLILRWLEARLIQPHCPHSLTSMMIRNQEDVIIVCIRLIPHHKRFYVLKPFSLWFKNMIMFLDCRRTFEFG